MQRGKSGPVTGTRGNVVFCDFGKAPAPPAPASELLADARCAIAGIGEVAAETLAAHAAASLQDRDNSRLLLQTLDRLENLAVQASLLAANAERGGEADLVAAGLSRFVSAGVAVSHRLRALGSEHRSWLSVEACVLRELAGQAQELEACAIACVEAILAEGLEADASG